MNGSGPITVTGHHGRGLLDSTAHGRAEGQLALNHLFDFFHGNALEADNARAMAFCYLYGVKTPPQALVSQGRFCITISDQLSCRLWEMYRNYRLQQAEETHAEHATEELQFSYACGYPGEA